MHRVLAVFAFLFIISFYFHPRDNITGLLLLNVVLVTVVRHSFLHGIYFSNFVRTLTFNLKPASLLVIGLYIISAAWLEEKTTIVFTCKSLLKELVTVGQ